MEQTSPRFLPSLTTPHETIFHWLGVGCPIYVFMVRVCVCVLCVVCSIYVTPKNVDVIRVHVTPKDQRFRETEMFARERETEVFVREAGIQSGVWRAEQGKYGVTLCILY